MPFFAINMWQSALSDNKYKLISTLICLAEYKGINGMKTARYLTNPLPDQPVCEPYRAIRTIEIR